MPRIVIKKSFLLKIYSTPSQLAVLSLNFKTFLAATKSKENINAKSL